MYLKCAKKQLKYITDLTLREQDHYSRLDWPRSFLHVGQPAAAPGQGGEKKKERKKHPQSNQSSLAQNSFLPLFPWEKLLRGSVWQLTDVTATGDVWIHKLGSSKTSFSASAYFLPPSAYSHLLGQFLKPTNYSSKFTCKYLCAFNLCFRSTTAINKSFFPSWKADCEAQVKVPGVTLVPMASGQAWWHYKPPLPTSSRRKEASNSFHLEREHHCDNSNINLQKSKPASPKGTLVQVQQMQPSYRPGTRKKMSILTFLSVTEKILQV